MLMMSVLETQGTETEASRGKQFLSVQINLSNLIFVLNFDVQGISLNKQGFSPKSVEY